MPEVPLVNEILFSGKLAYGQYGREFETNLRSYVGVENLLITNTFNMAILVALTTLGLKPGDKAIVSPMACLASTQPLLSMGIKVLWADVDPLLGTLDPESVRKLIPQNPNVIIHNHFCGYPGHIDEINAIGSEFGIPVVDDGIEAFGSEYKGKKVGNTGTDVTIFSFNAVRSPNTLDGGAVIFKDKALYQKSLLVRDAGINRARFRDEYGEINPDCDIEIIGHSATPMEINSYLGTQQMLNAEAIIAKQRIRKTFGKLQSGANRLEAIVFHLQTFRDIAQVLRVDEGQSIFVSQINEVAGSIIRLLQKTQNETAHEPQSSDHADGEKF